MHVSHQACQHIHQAKKLMQSTGRSLGKSDIYCLFDAGLLEYIFRLSVQISRDVSRWPLIWFGQKKRIFCIAFHLVEFSSTWSKNNLGTLKE